MDINQATEAFPDSRRRQKKHFREGYLASPEADWVTATVLRLVESVQNIYDKTQTRELTSGEVAFLHAKGMRFCREEAEKSHKAWLKHGTTSAEDLGEIVYQEIYRLYNLILSEGLTTLES